MVREAVESLRLKLGARRPTIGLVLGSGLGAYAETVRDPVSVPYAEIPHFLVPAVAGHAGMLWCGTIGEQTVVALQGRCHPYEGYSMADLVHPVRTLIGLGCRTIILTNAAGGINPAYQAGDLVLMSDHLNLLGQHPLKGQNDDALGPRFPDMTEVYSARLRNHARVCAEIAGLKRGGTDTIRQLPKDGVYAAMAGPSYETPAEIRMLQAMGADLVGMSTVHEAIAARHMGAEVIGISCVTNLAAGISPTPLSHDEVKAAADEARPRLVAWLNEIIGRLPQAA
ncbi:purine-nucleoside phosphorylase [Candidatus Uhrbacteria bacterium]|nr:purine-nucleoside phosphorylase [Candidatus Uhrbacteria bacterium]